MDWLDVPEAMVRRLCTICAALPESELTADRFAHTGRIRRRVFVQLFAVDDPAGRRVTMLVCTADPEERAALLAIGHPCFAPASGRDRLGVVLDHGTDWTEVAELVTESYRRLAPKKLAALV